MFEANGFVDLVYKHDKKAKYSYPSPIIMANKGAKAMEELKAKRKRIDFIFADETLQTFSTSGTIKISKELDMISDHYPTLAKFKLPSEAR
jgi:endonuclease/exonuclease/phosphatase family metal-dependent hydrolase